METAQAEEKVRAYAKRHSWDDDDTTLVLQVLGLMESPPPLRAVTRR